MPADDPSTSSAEVHAGHDLESGMLSRVRQWTDLLPWLRLMRVLRVAASPPLVLLSLVAWSVWYVGLLVMLPTPSAEAMRSAWASLPTLPWRWVGSLAAIESSWQVITAIAWWALVWSPVALVLTRQGALLTAGREMASLSQLGKHAAKRTPSAWLVFVIPLACVLLLSILIVPLGIADQLTGGATAARWIVAIVASVVALPAGVLLFGAIAAVPLGWSAIANEAAADPLDSLSRGYESLYRRPVHLLFYLLVCLVLLTVIAGLAEGVAQAASWVCLQVFSWTRVDAPTQVMAPLFLAQVSSAVVITFAWSLVGGVYLLLRYDCGSQEVEDLWLPEPSPTVSLPELPDSLKPSEELRNARLVTVAERVSEASAATLVAALRDAGIRATSSGEFTTGFRAEAPGVVRVQTLERDAEKARQVLSELKVQWPEDSAPEEFQAEDQDRSDR